MAELRVDDLAVRHGAREILKGVSLIVPPGKVAAVLGGAGSGKSTLMRAIAGFQTPHRGSIGIGEKVLFDAAAKIDLPAEARGLGIVFRSYALWPDRTVAENIGYGLELRAQIGLADVAGRYPEQLSGEQQQRVAVVRALVYQPAALLLEEPLSNLEGKPRDEARAWLRQIIACHELPALLVTRDPTQAMALGDRITLLHEGLVEQEGTPFDLYERPATVFAAELMGSNNRLEGTLVENTGEVAAIEVAGTRLDGVARTRAPAGERGSGIIRVQKVLLGGGPGQNRVLMRLGAQMYVGERWELVFAKDDLRVRAYASAPLKHEFYHVEFPAHALWIF
jgi:iron(III) transport system ATP-binding protein